MPIHAAGEFKIDSWDEDRYLEIGEEGGLARASVTQTFTGDLAGEGAVEYLMTYTSASDARFVGQQRVVGRLGDREGSFVLHLEGTYDGSKAEAAWSVVPGSGTDGLQGVRGEGRFSAPLGDTAEYTLDYDLE